jgi:hypothetical protein
MAIREESGGERHHVSYYLQGVNYPASKAELVSHAQARGADRDALDDLGGLSDTRFESIADVMRAVGEDDSGEMPA